MPAAPTSPSPTCSTAPSCLLSAPPRPGVPGLCLLVFGLLWLLSAAVAPAQEVGYRILVAMAAVRDVCPSGLLSFLVLLGSPSVTACVLLGGLVLGLLRRRWRRTLSVSAACVLLLAIATFAPGLSLYIDHGWFPHYATFPSGHMAGFLASCLVLDSLGDSRQWHTRIHAVTVIGGSLTALAILSTTAHTLWDLGGSVCLFLTARSLTHSRITL